MADTGPGGEISPAAIYMLRSHLHRDRDDDHRERARPYPDRLPPPDPAVPATCRIELDPPGPVFQFRFPHGCEYTRVGLQVPGLPATLEGIRIAHLTDLHLRRPWSAAYEKLVARVAGERPDLILITGDFVDDKRDCRPALPTLRRLLDGLAGAPRLGIYGILGNHDGDLLGPHLSGLPVTMLTSQRVLLDGGIELIGLPGPYRRDLTPAFLNTLAPRSADAVRMILSHYPDHLPRCLPLEPDVFLAGHTHGGQICLPNGFPPITHDGLPRRFAKGIHRVGRTWLVSNRGLGFAGLPFRVFCSTQVIELRLTAARQ